MSLDAPLLDDDNEITVVVDDDDSVRSDSCGDGDCDKGCCDSFDSSDFCDTPSPPPIKETEMTTIRPPDATAPLLPNKNQSNETKSYSTMATDYKTMEDEEPEQKVIMKTKLRVANICCYKEVELLKSTLAQECQGIDLVEVDQVGRRAVVQHDTSLCSQSDLIRVLNGVQLGVSIQEETRETLESDLKGIKRKVIFHVGMTVACIVLLGVILGLRLNGLTVGVVLIGVVMIVCGGFQILQKAFISAWFQKRIDIHVLMFIAIIGAVALQRWVEACVIVFACELANTIQLISQYRIQVLMSGLFLEIDVPSHVSMKDGTMKNIKEIRVGDILAIRPGDRVSLDGEVVRGSAAFDESAITGEAQPRNKSVGAKLLSGTLSTNGYVEMRVTTTSDESTINRLRDLVNEACASSGKSKVQQDIDKVVRYYTPAIVILAFLVGICGLIVESIRENGISKDRAVNWVMRALIVLISGCPCSLVMASPIVLLSGIAACATQKILVKHSRFLERFRNITSIVFDKTGTITEGRFRMNAMIWRTENGSFKHGQIHEEGTINTSKKNAYLTKVVAVESKSNHPLAPAIVGQYLGCVTSRVMEFGANVGLPRVTHFKVHEGLGVSGIVEGTHVQIGNEAFMGDFESDEVRAFINKAESQASTCILAKVDDVLVGAMAFSDRLRKETARVVRCLQDECQIDCALITGDNAAVANSIGRSCGMKPDAVFSEFRPREKLEWIENHKKDGQEVVCMVGDGINDSPALSIADVGIAMGASGTGLAVDSADVVLLNDDLNSIPVLYHVSRFCFTLLVENLIIAIGPKLIVVVMAIAGLYLENLLWLAVLVDALCLMVVVMNGTRAYACGNGCAIC